MRMSFKHFLESYRSKEDEIQRGKDSNAQSGHYHGIHMNVLIHPKSRDVDHGNRLSKEHWDDILSRAAERVKSKPETHFLMFSKKHQQGFVGHWMPAKKRMDVMTILPKGKKEPGLHTKLHTMESVIFE